MNSVFGRSTSRAEFLKSNQKVLTRCNTLTGKRSPLWELKKLIKSIGEKCKVSIRNIRREANEDLKKLLKDKQIGEDDEKIFEKKVQNITDDHIKSVDDKVSSKEKEIMTI